MLSDFGTLLLFIVAALVLLSAVLGVARWLRPHRPNVEKLTTYESGEEAVGTAAGPFNVRFYVIALVFVLFEIELVLLFPWATVFGRAEFLAEDARWGWVVLAEAVLFVLILAVGLAYAWGKGYLDWEKPRPNVPTTDSPVPSTLYQRLNEQYAPRP